MELINIGQDGDIRRDTKGILINPSSLDSWQKYKINVNGEILILGGRKIIAGRDFRKPDRDKPSPIQLYLTKNQGEHIKWETD